MKKGTVVMERGEREDVAVASGIQAEGQVTESLLRSRFHIRVSTSKRTSRMVVLAGLSFWKAWRARMMESRPAGPAVKTRRVRLLSPGRKVAIVSVFEER